MTITNNKKLKGSLLHCLNGRIMKNILDLINLQFYLLVHMFCPHVFVATNSYCCFFLKRIKKRKCLFYIKEFEIGYVLILAVLRYRLADIMMMMMMMMMIFYSCLVTLLSICNVQFYEA